MKQETIPETEIDLEVVEFKVLTTTEYLENLDDEKIRMMIRSQVAPMSFAMKQPHKLSVKKLLMLPWGKFNKLLIKFAEAQGLDSSFLVKK